MVILRRLGYVFIILALGYSGLMWGGDVVGAFNRSFRSPKEIESPFIELLDEASASQQRDRLLRAWRSGESYGLTQTRHSVEGDPIQLWLIVANRHAILVTDYTRDEHHGSRSYVIDHPMSLERNVGGDGNPLRAWFTDPHSIYILCRRSDGGTRFF
jgi:hypothetical protein